jgi:cephalosporin hydroxylase
MMAIKSTLKQKNIERISKNWKIWRFSNKILIQFEFWKRITIKKESFDIYTYQLMWCFFVYRSNELIMSRLHLQISLGL